MKKAIVILIAGLLFSGNAFAKKYPIGSVMYKDANKLHILRTGFKNLEKNKRKVDQIAINHCGPNKFTYLVGEGSFFGKGTLQKLYEKKGYKFTPFSYPYIAEYICSDKDYSSNPPNSFKPGEKYKQKWSPVKPKKLEPKITEKPKQSPDDTKVVAAASGSGFFVSKTGHIITNHHVIDECKAVKVNFKGDEIEAKILAIDKTNDLAILKANINPSKVYSVSNEDVTLLQDIIVAGFPLGKRVSAAIKTHKGSVSALAGFGDNYSNFQTDATINQGNSGGPVMDEKGNIVGVAVALMSAEAGQNIFFAVKSSTLKTFANANGITFLPPNNREMSNAELGQLITEGTLFLECWMTVAKIKQIIAQEENRKAFYSEHK